jgi:hypothetical protein
LAGNQLLDMSFENCSNWINLIQAVFIFLSTAQHALSSWHFCVNRFFRAIAIQAVEHLPFAIQLLLLLLEKKQSIGEKISYAM